MASRRFLRVELRPAVPVRPPFPSFFSASLPGDRSKPPRLRMEGKWPLFFGKNAANRCDPRKSKGENFPPASRGEIKLPPPQPSAVIPPFLHKPPALFPAPKSPPISSPARLELKANVSWLECEETSAFRAGSFSSLNHRCRIQILTTLAIVEAAKAKSPPVLVHVYLLMGRSTGRPNKHSQSLIEWPPSVPPSEAEFFPTPETIWKWA